MRQCIYFNVFLAVHCPILPQRRGLTASTQSTKMNTVIKFYCVNGNALIGAPEIVCLPSGNWSAPFPVCESKHASIVSFCYSLINPSNEVSARYTLYLPS